MASNPILPQPGWIILFGSGETSPTGRRIFDEVLDSLPPSPKLALLETPAGFELNSHQVISRVADFFKHRLQNYDPQVEIIPARKRGTSFSPDNPDIVEPLLHADLTFLGPGSPSYTIRQLRGSLAWNYLIARHRLGGVLALASAATVAFSSLALPVYEIYKVGEELHWIEGLDFFKLYGLNLVLIPHWNNHEGGTELDTSRCFMGCERFAQLAELLPTDMTMIGLDEKTALIMDPSKSTCLVKGLGNVTLIHTGHGHQSECSAKVYLKNYLASDPDLSLITGRRSGHFHKFRNGQVFSMNEIGQFHTFQPEATLTQGLWQKAIQAVSDRECQEKEKPPERVLQLIEQREKARLAANWNDADQLRNQITLLGWEIIDTKDGPRSKKQAKK